MDQGSSAHQKGGTAFYDKAILTSVHKRLVHTFGEVDAAAVERTVMRETNVKAELRNCVHRARCRAVKQKTLVQLFMQCFIQHVKTCQQAQPL